VGPIRTPQHRGPTGKLDAEKGERGGEGCPLYNQLGVWGALYKLLGGLRGKAPAENGFGEI